MALIYLEQRAVKAHQSGNLSAAELLYLRLLASDPLNFTARHLLGVLRFQQGRTAEALALMGDALKLKPTDPETLCNHGLILQSLGRYNDAIVNFDAAISSAPTYAPAFNNKGNALCACSALNPALESYDKAIKIEPRYVEAWSNRGIVLRKLRRYDEALSSFDRALEVDCSNIPALYNRANALLDLGRTEEAIADYDRALTLNPTHLEALYNRAGALLDFQRPRDALKGYEACLSLNPNDAEVWNNTGIAHRKLDQLEPALKCFENALSIRKDFVEAYSNRAGVLHDLGQYPEALQSYTRALAINPTLVTALIGQATALKKLRRFEESLAKLDAALLQDPISPGALFSKGNVLLELKHYREALSCFQICTEIDPLNADAWCGAGSAHMHLDDFEGALFHYKAACGVERYHIDAFGGAANAALHLCDWETVSQMSDLVDDAIQYNKTAFPPFTLLGYRDDPEQQRVCSINYVNDRIPVRPKPISSANRYSHSRIRVGYVSADFCEHPVGRHIVEVLERHDKKRFEIFVFSLAGGDKGDTSKRISQASDRFCDASRLSDHEVAMLISALEIDIAIDLMGHTQDARLGIFSHRPAPVQIGYLGYPGTVGAEFFDYLIADSIVLPHGTDASVIENIIRLPSCYLPPCPVLEIDPAPSRAQARLPDAGFVYCCFNAPWKITEDVFLTWIKILKAVPESILWLRHAKEKTRDNILREAATHGVDCSRLIFAPKVPLREHLARCRLADLFLDTVPYNAHSTGHDVLGVGMPLLTCAGKSFHSLVGKSLLLSAGLQSLVTTNLDEYMRTAISLANDESRLRELRERLCAHTGLAAKTNAERFCRAIESAYQNAVEISNAGQRPRSFDVLAAPSSVRVP